MALTLNSLWTIFGGVEQSNPDRLLTNIEVGHQSLHAQIFLDPNASDGIRVDGSAKADAAVRARLGLPVRRPPIAAVSAAITLPVIDPRTWDGVPVPERDWFAPHIPMRTVTNLSGEGGSGKTGLALQLMAASALGVPWLGHDVMRGPSVYYGAEDEIHINRHTSLLG